MNQETVSISTVTKDNPRDFLFDIYYISSLGTYPYFDDRQVRYYQKPLLLCVFLSHAGDGLCFGIFFQKFRED
jgi:hypothetical protein